MATATVTRSGTWTTTISGMGIASDSKYFSVINNTNPASSSIRSKIPKYADITKVTFSGSGKYTYASTDYSAIDLGSYRWYKYKNSDNENTSGYATYNSNFKEIPKGTLNTYTNFTSGNVLNSLTNFQSKTAKAGQFNGPAEYGTGSSDPTGTAAICLRALAWEVKDIQVQNFTVNYTYTEPSLKISAAANGSVSNAGTYKIDKQKTDSAIVSIDCTANPSNKYRFLKWSDGNEQKTRTFSENDLTSFSTTITAEFLPIYEVKINLNGGTGGTTDFWYDKFGLWNETNGSTPGKITLKNPTKTGYTFLGWSGTGINGYSTTVEIPAGSTGDRTYNANWQINQYTVTLQSSPSDAAIVKAKLKDGTEFTNSMLLDYNTQFALISATNQNTDKYVFEKFSRTNKTDLAGDSNSILTSEAVPSWNITYTAHYNLRKYSISAKSVLITKDEDGRETETQEECAIFELNGSSSFDDQEYGKTIYISFLPKFGYKFVKWKGVELSKANNSVLETQVYSDIYITACFEKINPIENSLPDNIETLPTEEKNNLIRSIANSIVNKTIINYINTVQMSEIGDYAFYKCENLKFVNIPNIAMSALGKYSFCGCKNLTSIRIPENITRINSNAFANCINLTTLILPRTSSIVELESIDTLLNTPFNQSLYQKKFGYIYVPKDLIGEYQTDTNWCAFSDHFRTIEDYPEICGG